MKKSNPWDIIAPNDKTPWIKLPCWGYSFLSKIGITDSEVSVLFFLFMSVGNDVSDVLAPTQVGLKFTAINDRTFFRAIKKFKDLGLVKTGNGRYDLTGLLDNLAKSKTRFSEEKAGLLENQTVAALVEGLE